jgi:hypothetical protein
MLQQCDLTTAATRRHRSCISHRIRSTPLIQSFPEPDRTPGRSQQDWSRDGEAKDVEDEIVKEEIMVVVAF